MSDQQSEYSPAMQQAIELLRQGQPEQAEEVMLRAVEEARGLGEENHSLAVAQNEIGLILLNVGQPVRALEAFRQACAGPMPAEEKARKDRLSFLLNQGMALEINRQLPEAEAIYRQSLNGRFLLYGKDHPGYAFALEPLAENLLRQGRADEARDLIEEAVEIFWNNNHPRLATALAIRAEIYKAAEVDKHPFGDLVDLPDELVASLAEIVIERTQRSDLRLCRPVLADLLPFIKHRLGEDHQSVLNALSATANLERHLGDHDTRQQAIREAIAILDRQSRNYEALNATLGLALAQTEAQQSDEALTTYKNALLRSQMLGDSTAKSQVLRNYGLYLAELDRREEAEKHIRLAIMEGEQSSSLEMLGRSQIAYGVFLQHGENLKEARSWLDQGLHNVAPEHPDALTARSHLDALLAGVSCICGDRGKALADGLRESVLSQLPEGMIRDLDVRARPDGNFDISVRLDRELNQEEMDQINNVINQTLGEFRQRVLQPG